VQYTYANATNGQQFQQHQKDPTFPQDAAHTQQFIGYSATTSRHQQEFNQYNFQQQEQHRAKQDVWTSIEEIAGIIIRTEGIPPQISTMIQMMIQLVMTQKPQNGSPP
jgi:hypothetical protein